MKKKKILYNNVFRFEKDWWRKTVPRRHGHFHTRNLVVVVVVVVDPWTFLTYKTIVGTWRLSLRRKIVLRTISNSCYKIFGIKSTWEDRGKYKDRSTYLRSLFPSFRVFSLSIHVKNIFLFPIFTSSRFNIKFLQFLYLPFCLSKYFFSHYVVRFYAIR